MRGPGQANWDMSVFKTLVIKETFKAQFRLRGAECLQHAAVFMAQV